MNVITSQTTRAWDQTNRSKIVSPALSIFARPIRNITNARNLALMGAAPFVHSHITSILFFVYL